MCTHGGIVTAVPAIHTAYRIDGVRPLLMGYTYIVSGCPFSVGSSGMPCQMVNWVTASNFLIIKGQPALTSSSVGLTIGAGPALPVIITSIQSSMQEPGEFTNIDY